MKTRNQLAVPRYQVVSENKDSEKKNYHRQLILFIPWRKEEDDILQGHTLYEEMRNLIKI